MLNSLEIPYMLSGSLAFNIYAIPRATRDINLVVELKSGDVGKFISAIKEHYYYNEQTIIEEIKRNGFFNIIDNRSIFKIDFIILKNTEFEMLKFSRRKNIEFENFSLSVITPEDLILSKLLWIQQMESELQKSDIRYMLQYPQLDYDYIRNWITKLGIQTFGIEI